MKKIKLLFAFILFSTFTFAQKFNPEIKSGTSIGSVVIMQGQEIEVLININKDDKGVGMKWSVPGFGEGEFKMTNAGVENGSMMYAGQPGMGLTQLTDSETFGMISKAAFKSIVDNKTLTYNGVKYVVKNTAEEIKVNDQVVDAHHLVTEDGKNALWILNNAEYPLVLQSMGQPMDIIIITIK